MQEKPPMNEKLKNKLGKLYRFSNSWTGTVIIVLLVIFFVAQAFVIPSGSMMRTLLIGDHLFVKKFAYGIPIPHIPWIEVPVLPDFNGNGHLINGDKPKRGDIVIFRYPPEPKVHYVKRCVAVGGDEIIYMDKKLLIHPHEGDAYLEENYPAERLTELLGKKWVINPYMIDHPFIQYDNSQSYEQLLNFARFGRIAMDTLNTPDGVVFYKKIPESEFFMVGDNRDHSNDSRFWGGVEYKDIVGKPWFIYFSWDDDYLIRWDRMFRSVAGMEEEALEKRISEKEKTDVR